MVLFSTWMEERWSSVKLLSDQSPAGNWRKGTTSARDKYRSCTRGDKSGRRPMLRLCSNERYVSFVRATSPFAPSRKFHDRSMKKTSTMINSHSTYQGEPIVVEKTTLKTTWHCSGDDYNAHASLVDQWVELLEIRQLILCFRVKRLEPISGGKDESLLYERSRLVRDLERWFGKTEMLLLLDVSQKKNSMQDPFVSYTHVEQEIKP